ncbi:hypothetical protein [Sulfurimonas sp.]|uniref:CiaD-like domain-containing protein n=1 Tax=Sulfurimonas sp. TaxID=2022749 RepID=UPI001A0ACDDD|nr:hypothetical protein [Sulfurimonas sp.]MBE0514328.1 hypothetical protein [Sulfurimonas sp.]MDT8338498.1 hypothetical protein [Sulfurimonas sp.]
MELKDVILSTLAEMENQKPEKNITNSLKPIKEAKDITQKEQDKEPEQEVENEDEFACEDGQSVNSELLFLKSMRERLLVLFEGFQAPNNTNIEAKIDMTLNFLEYLLVTIDSRAEEIERGKRR